MKMRMQYHRDMDWGTYLLERESTRDLFAVAQEQADVLRRGQALNAAQQSQALRAMERGFGKLVAGQAVMTAVMMHGFDALKGEIRTVRASIDQLRADFNWGIGEVLWNLETQNKTLQAILTTLQAPLDTQAKELRRRAEEAYRNEWYDEALGDLLESEQKNYQDFAVHLAIANIYLYQHQPAELDRALEYYLKAGKYAAPVSSYHAAIGYMFAGFTAYLKRDDRTALAHARRATDLAPDFAEAWFNLAKFAASAKSSNLCLPALEQAIRLNRSYALKARSDHDFDAFETDITALIEALRDEARQLAEQEFASLEQRRKQATLRWGERLITERMNAIQVLMLENTYFGYLDAQIALRGMDGLFVVPETHNKSTFGRCRSIVRHEGGQIVGAIVGKTHLYLSNFTTSNTQEAVTRSEKEEIVLYVLNRQAKLIVFSSQTKTLSHLEVWEVGKAANAPLSKITPGTKVLCLDFSPDGTRIAAGLDNDTAAIWDAHSGKLLTTLRGHTRAWGGKGMQFGFAWGVPSLHFSSDNKHIVTGGGDKSVRLWDATTGTELRVFQGHTDVVRAVACSPDGQLIASAGDDKTVRLWDVNTGTARGVMTGHTSMVHLLKFSPDGVYLASGSADNTIGMWDVLASRQTTQLKHSDAVISLEFEADSRALYAGTRDGFIHCWPMMVSQQPSLPSTQGARIVHDGRSYTCSGCGGYVRADATLCKHCKQSFR